MISAASIWTFLFFLITIFFLFLVHHFDKLRKEKRKINRIKERDKGTGLRNGIKERDKGTG